MQIADYIVQLTGLSRNALFLGPQALVVIKADASGALAIAQWNVPGVAQPTPAEIAAALAAPPAASVLVAYANAKQWALAIGGHNVEIAGQTYLFATDPTSLALIAGKALRLQQSGAPASVLWQFSNGFAAIAAADFTAASVSVADWVQSTFAALQTVLAAIASGAIATTAEIDAAAWPAP